jgi:hypothetical protein
MECGLETQPIKFLIVSKFPAGSGVVILFRTAARSPLITGRINRFCPFCLQKFA